MYYIIYGIIHVIQRMDIEQMGIGLFFTPRVYVWWCYDRHTSFPSIEVSSYRSHATHDYILHQPVSKNLNRNIKILKLDEYVM